MNPYHAAAVRKQKALRTLRLPAAEPEGFHGSAAVHAFMESTEHHRWAGKNGSQKQLAQRLTDQELAMLIDFYTRATAREQARLRELGAHTLLVQNAGEPKVLALLQRVLESRST